MYFPRGLLILMYFTTIANDDPFINDSSDSCYPCFFRATTSVLLITSNQPTYGCSADVFTVFQASIVFPFPPIFTSNFWLISPKIWLHRSNG